MYTTEKNEKLTRGGEMKLHSCHRIILKVYLKSNEIHFIHNFQLLMTNTILLTYWKVSLIKLIAVQRLMTKTCGHNSTFLLLLL
jgi:hypothetical protein